MSDDKDCSDTVVDSGSMSFKERLVIEISKRKGPSLLSDFLPKEIMDNGYLKDNFFKLASSDTASEIASALIMTFSTAVLSISRTGMLDMALLTLTKALVGGAEAHVAKRLDGYFNLLRAFNRRLHDVETGKAVTNGKVEPDKTYELRLIDPSSPTLVTPNNLPASGRIEIDPFVYFWYNESFSMENTTFNIGKFVNTLCGATAFSYMKSKDLVTYSTPEKSRGSSYKRPLPIERKCGRLSDLPSLHLLRI